MQLDEDAVRDALEGLQQQRMAGPARGADSRVTKYEQRLQEVFNFTRAEIGGAVRAAAARSADAGRVAEDAPSACHRFEALEDVHRRYRN